MSEVIRQTPKCRENPVVIKLNTPEFKSIFTPELNDLSALFEKYKYEIRIAGGAVRDLLSKQIPKDIDFATNATPDQMKEMFMAEEIRMINMKGEKHGTITARINDKENFEVTTLRIDVLTDGRHAEVEFTQDWKLDANRRDLTINSMFLALDGSVYDYFFGYEDLQQRKIAFVGDADSRIKEDYLRILRYFRFYGRIAEHADNHDEVTLRVINQNVSGLERISGERIWMELKKILEGKFAGELVKTMLHVGVAKYCGLLHENECLDQFSKLWERSGNLKMKAVTLLCGLLRNQEDALKINERLKMSIYDRELALFLLRNRDIKPDSKPLLTYQRLVIKEKFKITDVKEWTLELLKYQGREELLHEFTDWNIPRMPIPGNVLREKFNILPGKFLGLVLDELKKYWIDKEFQPQLEELLQQVPDIVTRLEAKKLKK